MNMKNITEDLNNSYQLNATYQADVIVVGGGPAGLSFAKAIASTGLNIMVIEKNSEDNLANPAYDGREIALTHASKRLMERLGMWQLVNPEEIYLLKEACVTNGNSPYQLYFAKPRQVFGQTVEGLGYLISNHNIRKSAYDSVKLQKNIQLLCGKGVKQVATFDDFANVELEDGTLLRSKLLVVADSRFSNSRRQLGISADSHDFGRTMIVCRMTNTISNQQRATEHFYYGITVALLPLNEYTTNCVITATNAEVQQLLTLSPTDFARQVENFIDMQLGDMQLVSTQHTYPLVAVHANRFYTKRCALIGDSAVGMHPVTAHGFNLGLHSVEILAKYIEKAVKVDGDIGSENLLAKYQREHMLITRPMYHGTNTIAKLFTTETPTAKALRSLVLRVSNNLPPLKMLITKQLTG